MCIIICQKFVIFNLTKLSAFVAIYCLFFLWILNKNKLVLPNQKQLTHNNFFREQKEKFVLHCIRAERRSYIPIWWMSIYLVGGRRAIREKITSISCSLNSKIIFSYHLFPFSFERATLSWQLTWVACLRVLLWIVDEILFPLFAFIKLWKHLLEAIFYY